MRIFVLTNEDREIIGACEDMTTAKNLAREHAAGFDCETGPEIYWPPSETELKGFWRIPCFPNDSDLGFLFDLIVEIVDYFPKGTEFPEDEINAYADIPAFLRRQAE